VVEAPHPVVGQRGRYGDIVPAGLERLLGVGPYRAVLVDERADDVEKDCLDLTKMSAVGRPR
jgi:hypothetical protein